MFIVVTSLHSGICGEISNCHQYFLKHEIVFGHCIRVVVMGEEPEDT